MGSVLIVLESYHQILGLSSETAVSETTADIQIESTEPFVTEAGKRSSTKNSSPKSASADKQTPLMKQYLAIKAKYPETVLFFRMGDFFETFGEDAITLSKVTGIVLTKRGAGAASETELAGFPHHQLDSYLPKMIRAGYRVAVCEQLEDPKLAKGIVKRDVVEVVTPGVQTSEKLLEKNRNTYVGALVVQGGIAGIAYADVSTGEFVAGELAEHAILEHLEAIGISELLTPRKDVAKLELAPYFIGLQRKPAIAKRDDWIFHPDTARALLLEHFQTTSLKGFGIENAQLAIIAAGAVLDYLRETRSATTLQHVTRLTLYDPGEILSIDSTTRRNLELIYPLNPDGADSSLLAVLDETSTPMGARQLRKWMARPSRNVAKVRAKQDAIESLMLHRELRDRIQMELREVGDMERLLGRFASARILSPRDFLSMKFTLWHIGPIKENFQLLAQAAEPEEESLIRTIANDLALLNQLAEEIDRIVDPEPPAVAGQLGVIRDGANPELDELRRLTSSSRQSLVEIQTRERERTGIPSLKVDFNNVFGYYIEVTKTHSAKVPDDYERRQTMTNAERYTTPELKSYEEKILGAQDRMLTLEREMADKLRVRILQDTTQIQRDAELLALGDVLVTFSTLATRMRWVRPEFGTGEEMTIEAGRHPVVEKLLPIGERFTPNSVSFTPDQKEFYVITGPNMAGKSVFLRQTGVLAYLAHIGSFIPAESARIPAMDRIFARVGASDNIASGESTFLVEMNEAANILNNATSRSLLLFDELGRGTSTFDGISIAWAIAEFIHDAIPGARTLFATHYHELNALADRYDRIHNLKVEVREAEGKVHFLHKIAAGYADHSYGIEVAAMAGIPREVILRAREVLRSLESTELRIAEAEIQREIPFAFEERVKRVRENERREAEDVELGRRITEALRNLDVNNLTPIEALRALADLKDRM
jgi:DNA mismatch repair protein MutS